MNLLKSLFVSVYMMAAMIVLAFAVRSLMVSGDAFAWGGVILVYAPFIMLLTWIMIFRNVARTSARFPIVIGLAVAGVAAAAWGGFREGSVVAPVLALTGFIAFLVYDFWYSSFGRVHSSRLGIGQMLPAFEVRDTAGAVISSTSLAGKPTVWIVR